MDLQAPLKGSEDSGASMGHSSPQAAREARADATDAELTAAIKVAAPQQAAT